MLRSPSDATALLLYPTKALAQDQLRSLAALEVPGLVPAAYDGDTDADTRAWVRRHANVVLTNPDMLHTGILPHHTRWADLFANLKYVVLDEVHTYRGVFGSHMANVLRRLRRICAFYGSRPQFVCASATIANPQALAEKLIEAPVTLVPPDADGSPRATRDRCRRCWRTGGVRCSPGSAAQRPRPAG